MINVTRINDRELTLNCELIESIEKNPDTTVTMTTGKKFIVKDSVEDLVEKTVAYKQRINQHVK